MNANLTMPNNIELAIQTNNKPILEEFLKTNQDNINCKYIKNINNKKYYMPLIYYALYNLKYDLVYYLLSYKNINLNEQCTIEGNEFPNILGMFLAFKSIVTNPDNNLICTKLIQELINHGAEFDKIIKHSPIYYVVQWNLNTILNLFIQNKLNINASIQIEEIEYDNLLAFAISSNTNINFIEILIINGATFKPSFINLAKNKETILYLNHLLNIRQEIGLQLKTMPTVLIDLITEYTYEKYEKKAYNNKKLDNIIKTIFKANKKNKNKLIETNINKNCLNFYKSIMNKDFKLMQELIINNNNNNNNSININAPFTIQFSKKYKYDNALHLAIKVENFAAIKYLLEKGAYLNPNFLNYTKNKKIIDYLKKYLYIQNATQISNNEIIGIISNYSDK